eukprot:m.20736 g.20736  ORF g.20736 m.20736 type:complete len:91 (-) comp5280_c0_seq1:61-333(-)
MSVVPLFSNTASSSMLRSFCTHCCNDSQVRLIFAHILNLSTQLLQINLYKLLNKKVLPQVNNNSLFDKPTNVKKIKRERKKNRKEYQHQE